MEAQGKNNEKYELVVTGQDVKKLARLLIDWEIPFVSSGCTLVVSSIHKKSSLQYTSVPFTNKAGLLRFIERKGKKYNITIAERL